MDNYPRTSVPPYSSACDTYAMAGRDLVYQFTAATTGTVQANLTPSAGFDPALLLLTGSCSASACLSAIDTGFSGDVETLNFSVVAGQTYFLVVDVYSATSSNGTGSFTLEVH